MPYPYEPGLENYSRYLRTLPELAETSHKPQIGRFCSGLDHVKAYALDKIKDKLTEARKSAYFSADAMLCLYGGKNGRFYFIEFKDQPINNIKRGVVFGKAVDCLTIASYTFAQDQTIIELTKKSVYILVYDSPDMKIEAALGKFAEQSGSPKDQYDEQILIGLEFLKENEYYSEVHTWTPEAFRRHFIEHLP